VLISIDAADARPIYVQIMDEIKRAIVVGTVTSHDAAVGATAGGGASGEPEHGAAGVP
jgi:hypothetical protein